MRESEFYKKIREPLMKRGHLSRIENKAGAGVPDVTFATSGMEFWLELKVEKGNLLYFEPSQPIWMKERIKVGVMPLILWLSSDESTIHLCEAESLIRAKKTYIRGFAVAQSSDLRQWLFLRKPKTDWDKMVKRMIMTKVPKSL